MKLDEHPHQHEAHAESSRRAIRGALSLNEQVEGPRQQLWRHPDTVIAHRDHRLAALRGRDDRELPTGVSVLRGVVDQVPEHLDQTHRIRLHHDCLGIERERQLVPFFDDQRAAHLHCLPEDHVQIDALLLDLDLTPAHAGRVQEVVEEALHVPYLPHDDPSILGAEILVAC